MKKSFLFVISLLSVFLFSSCEAFDNLNAKCCIYLFKKTKFEKVRDSKTVKTGAKNMFEDPHYEVSDYTYNRESLFDDLGTWNISVEGKFDSDKFLQAATKKSQNISDNAAFESASKFIAALDGKNIKCTFSIRSESDANQDSTNTQFNAAYVDGIQQQDDFPYFYMIIGAYRSFFDYFKK